MTLYPFASLDAALRGTCATHDDTATSPVLGSAGTPAITPGSFYF